MLPDDIVTDGQPQAGAISLCSKEWIENQGQSFIAYQRARIMEIHANTPAIRAGAETYSEPASLICFHRFQGIQAKVNKNLF
jgi:hypothetical protein